MLSFLFKQLKGAGTAFFVAQAAQILWRLALKFVAYHLGKFHGYLPRQLNRKLSLSKNHWKG
jgi:hypothetical protein